MPRILFAFSLSVWDEPNSLKRNIHVACRLLILRYSGIFGMLLIYVVISRQEKKTCNYSMITLTNSVDGRMHIFQDDWQSIVLSLCGCIVFDLCASDCKSHF